MLYDTNREADLFAKYDVHDIFECRILSVDPTSRGKGIARTLMERSIQEARIRGFKLFKVYFLQHEKIIAEPIFFCTNYILHRQKKKWSYFYWYN